MRETIKFYHYQKYLSKGKQMMTKLIQTQYPVTNAITAYPVIYEVNNDEVPHVHKVNIYDTIPEPPQPIAVAKLHVTVENLGVGDYTLKIADIDTFPLSKEVIEPGETKEYLAETTVNPSGEIFVVGVPNNSVNLTIRFIWGLT